MSRSQMLFILCILENFTKLTEKYLCRSLFYNNVAELQPATLLKKRLSRVFSCEFSEIFKNTFFYRHLRATASSCYFFVWEVVNPWQKTVFSAKCNFSEIEKWVITETNSVSFLRMNQPLSISFWINGDIKLHNIK